MGDFSWSWPAAKWLILQGLLPLLGAAVLFLVWGGIRYVTADNKQNFKYSWGQWRDPIAWLYGGAIISVQAGSTSASIHDATVLMVGSFMAGVICILVLLSAMTNRGENENWKPPRSLEVVAVLLILVILLAGYRAEALAAAGGAQ